MNLVQGRNARKKFRGSLILRSAAVPSRSMSELE